VVSVIVDSCLDGSGSEKRHSAVQELHVDGNGIESNLAEGVWSKCVNGLDGFLPEVAGGPDLCTLESLSDQTSKLLSVFTVFRFPLFLDTQKQTTT
jgi:hypothetical protein